MTNTHLSQWYVLSFSFIFVSLFCKFLLLFAKTICDAMRPNRPTTIHSTPMKTNDDYEMLTFFLPPDPSSSTALYFGMASHRFDSDFVMCFASASAPPSLHFTFPIHSMSTSMSVFRFVRRSLALTQNNKINWNEIIRSLSETTGWTEIKSIYEEERWCRILDSWWIVYWSIIGNMIVIWNFFISNTKNQNGLNN